MDIYVDDDIRCDNLESLLLHTDSLNGYLKKLEQSCVNFGTKFKCSVLDSISKNSECVKHAEESAESLSALLNEKKEMKASLDEVKNRQKSVEKKTINAIKRIDKTKSEISSLKEKEEQLLLEIVDLEQETEKTKEYMKKQWGAVKIACMVYKNNLDIHIDTEQVDHDEHVTVSFFYSENPTNKKFFVVLVNEDDCWRVKKIEPELSVEHKYQLNHVVQFSKSAEVTSVPLLLCELRKLFISSYFES
ncbi:hypothetical protein QAD02_003855 [Eretmocerus hayati]|uniref:Uncharacterized protein n=1 Tax=Eretmocerus hayati TaxID=131215 RepID=A0ACC2NPQ4_9HYME|nr:hypothetical protein QAD02_003855 [Eretmocerus hayati]